MEQQDLSKLSEEEMQALADEINGADQPRDDKGRFVAKEEAEDNDLGEKLAESAQEVDVEEEEEEAQPEKWFVREIDLGDGSGKQVFKGRSLEELADRLAEAQTHATRKIRELSQERKRTAQEEADNEFVLQQELLNKPSETLRRKFEEMVGMPIDSFKTKIQKVEAFEKAQSAEEASKEFVQSHEDYYASPGNGKRMGAYLNRMGLDWTVENMEKAFKELSSDGLLAERPEQQEVTAENKAEQEPTRIANPVQKPVVQKRVAGSGLSAKRSAVAPKPKPAEPSIEDLYKMPLEELRERANSEARKSQDSGLAY